MTQRPRFWLIVAIALAALLVVGLVAPRLIGRLVGSLWVLCLDVISQLLTPLLR